MGNIEFKKNEGLHKYEGHLGIEVQKHGVDKHVEDYVRVTQWGREGVEIDVAEIKILR